MAVGTAVAGPISLPCALFALSCGSLLLSTFAFRGMDEPRSIPQFLSRGILPVGVSLPFFASIDPVLVGIKIICTVILFYIVVFKETKPVGR